jgi:hypothetical protein
MRDSRSAVGGAVRLMTALRCWVAGSVRAFARRPNSSPRSTQNIIPNRTQLLESRFDRSICRTAPRKPESLRTKQTEQRWGSQGRRTFPCQKARPNATMDRRPQCGQARNADDRSSLDRSRANLVALKKPARNNPFS